MIRDLLLRFGSMPIVMFVFFCSSGDAYAQVNGGGGLKFVKPDGNTAITRASCSVTVLGTDTYTSTGSVIVEVFAASSVDGSPTGPSLGSGSSPAGGATTGSSWGPITFVKAATGPSTAAFVFQATLYDNNAKAIGVKTQIVGAQ